MDEKRGIGRDNGIPWHIPEDFKHFKELTLNHPIIMGRRTFESLGRLLPDRTHIVITHDVSDKTSVEGLIWTDSLESAIEKAKKEKALRQAQDKKESDEIFIIGGGEIFKEALEKNLVDRLYLTIIDGDFGADTFFPDYSGFKETNSEKLDNGKNKFCFKILKIQK